MVARQTLAAIQIIAVLPAILAAVIIAGEKDGIRDVLPEAAWDLDVLYEPDHERIRVFGLLASEPFFDVRLDDLGLFGDDEDNGPLDRNEGHWLEAGIESQASSHAENFSISA